MALHGTAFLLLIANGVWDVACAFFMLVEMLPISDSCLVSSCMADTHFALWAQEADRSNPAAKVLFTILVLQWGVMRFVAAFDDNVMMALFSYGFEALLMLVGLAAGMLEPRKGCAVLALSLACALVLLVLPPDSPKNHHNNNKTD